MEAVEAQAPLTAANIHSAKAEVALAQGDKETARSELKKAIAALSEDKDVASHYSKRLTALM